MVTSASLFEDIIKIASGQTHRSGDQVHNYTSRLNYSSKCSYSYSSCTPCVKLTTFEEICTPPRPCFPQPT